MQFQIRSPRNPLEWIATVLAVGVVVAVGVVLASVAIVVIGVTILVAPVIAWWRSRKGVSASNEFERTETHGRIVDVEYEVEEKED
jgi:hypothetical protein